MIRKIVRVSSKGQIVIPKEIRKKAQIEQGDYLAVALQDEKIILKKEENRALSIEETGSTLYKGSFSTEDLLRFLSQDCDWQEHFKNLINKAQQEKKVFFVSLTVIIELVYLLERRYKLPREEVRKIVEGLLCLPVEIENMATIEEALRVYEITEYSFLKALLIAERYQKKSWSL